MSDAPTSERGFKAVGALSLRVSLLALSATMLGAAIFARFGIYSTAAISFLSVAMVLALAAVLIPAGAACFVWMPRAMCVVLLACLATQFALGICGPPVDNHLFLQQIRNPETGATTFLPRQLTLYWAVLAIAAVICGQLVTPRLTLGGFTLPLLIVLQVIAAVWVIHRDVDPFIDVFGFQTKSCQALLHGQNPYAITFDSIYNLESTRRVYAPGDYSEDGLRLLFGYLYTPLVLLLTLPGYLVGDIRYSMIAAVAVAAALMGSIRRTRLGMVAAVGVLFMPRTLNVIDLSWNEPLVVMLLALTIFCAIRLPKLTPFALGLLLVSKQYMPFALVFSPLLFGWNWRRLGAALLRAGITAAVVTLPLVLPNVGAFIHSAILFQIRQPFRRDALSFLILWARTTGMAPSAVPGFVALLVVGALVLWRLRPSPANFAAAVAVSYFAFFAFNKQAFMNYYFFIIAALWCSVAALDFPLLAMAESR
jgi:hypothetical protein